MLGSSDQKYDRGKGQSDSVRREGMTFIIKLDVMEEREGLDSTSSIDRTHPVQPIQEKEQV